MATEQKAPEQKAPESKAASGVVRVPKHSIVVTRDGKSMTPPIGEPFSFTKEEIEQIEKMLPEALGTEAVVDVTKPVNVAGEKAGKAKTSSTDDI